MADESVKRKMRRAKSAVIETLEKAGYDIIPSDNSRACVVGLRSTETRVIRVVIDEVTDHDIDLIKNLRGHPGTCKKEIWCRIGNDFTITEI